MKHDDDKIFNEKFAKEVLEKKGILSNIIKSESPDLIIKDKKIGIEVTKVFQNDGFDGYIKKYSQNIKNIERFNKGYKKNGGRVFHKNSAIVKILNLSTGPYSNEYSYIIPSYQNNNFQHINNAILKKLDRLENVYSKRKDIETFHLAILTPMYFTISNVIKEIKEIEKLQTERKYKYDFIYIILISGNIIIFNTKNKTCKIV